MPSWRCAVDSVWLASVRLYFAYFEQRGPSERDRWYLEPAPHTRSCATGHRARAPAGRAAQPHCALRQLRAPARGGAGPRGPRRCRGRCGACRRGRAGAAAPAAAPARCPRLPPQPEPELRLRPAGVVPGGAAGAAGGRRRRRLCAAGGGAPHRGGPAPHVDRPVGKCSKAGSLRGCPLGVPALHPAERNVFFLLAGFGATAAVSPGRPGLGSHLALTPSLAPFPPP